MPEAQVHVIELKNGLKIIGEIQPKNQSAAVGFFVRTGARDELRGEEGISHFLEHMMFKGTENKSALDLTYELGNIGAQANAYTSEETTVYYSSVLPENFDRMVSLLAEMLRPALDSAEFDTEKKVILEEIALYDDRPQFYLFQNAFKDYFGSHTAGNLVLGTNASVSAISRDDMRHYFDRRYAPSNMVLVATGNFDWGTFLAQVKAQCSSWPSYNVERETMPHEAALLNKEYRKKNIQQAHLLLISGGCAAQDDERYAMAILASILGDATGSKLYWELVDKGIAESAGADSDEKDGTGCFLAYASVEPGRLDEVATIVRRILGNPMDFSAEDLERAKTKFATRLVLSGELPMGRLMSLGNEWVYRKELHSLSNTLARIKAVNRGEIERALKRYPLKTWAEFRLIPES